MSTIGGTVRRGPAARIGNVRGSMYPWRIAFSAMLLLGAVGVRQGVAQQQMESPMRTSDPTDTSKLSCDPLDPTCDVRSRPARNPNASDTGELSPVDRDSPQDSQFEFGNGQPLNLSARDYTVQNRGPRPEQSTNWRRHPEQPTEFQTFVAASLGQVLPIYGSQLFEGVAPSTFAPLDRVPVTPGYVLAPGDELLMRAWGGITFYLRETIDRDGNIYIPHVGQIEVANIAFADTKRHLAEQIGRVFRRFDLSVEMGQLRSMQVFVVGKTLRPGSYTVSSLSTLINALFACGGPSRGGSMRAIEVRRGGDILAKLDLYRLLLSGDKSQDVALLPGDIIYIPPAGPRVAIAGSVGQAAIYELRPGETVGDAIKLAGGLSSLASSGSAELERLDAGAVRHIVDLDLSEQGLKTPMRDGDVLRVISITPRFDNAVTLRGNVANPGRYAWHAGIRIRDLIPNKEALLTRDYWRRRNDLALNEVRRSPILRGQLSQGTAATERNDADDTSRSALLPNADYDPRVDSPSAERLPASPGNDLRSNARPDDAGLTTREVSGRSIASSTEKPSSQFPLTNRVELGAPEIDWDYAVIQRINAEDLTTTLKPFSLRAVVLQHDDQQNAELEPGDVVTVFSQADIRVPQTRQIKLVRLEGEFNQSGVYSVGPGETLRDLVRRAGGLTSQAYLFGSSFTRESTREQQQARLDEYAASLEEEIERGTANRSHAVVNVQEASVISAGLESQRALVGKLRLVRSTGRIVLDIAPDKAQLDSIPPIPLEDGDSFVVPPQPSNVAVVGAVYDQNAFVFETKRRAGDYLQLAGGITRNGDARHTFVVRADGSVVGRHSRYVHGRGGLERLSLNPGDTVVVPEIINRATLLRGLTDWSAVFSQFALGAAAINLLH